MHGKYQSLLVWNTNGRQGKEQYQCENPAHMVLRDSSFEHFFHYRTILYDCQGIAGFIQLKNISADLLRATGAQKL
jgi:hypothetical protein